MRAAWEMLRLPAPGGSHVRLERYHQGAPGVAEPAWKKSVRTWQFSLEGDVLTWQTALTMWGFGLLPIGGKCLSSGYIQNLWFC